MVLKAITKNCDTCDSETQMVVESDDYQSWQNGKLIQDAMPYLTISQRELLISGICGTCFDKMFGGFK